MYKALAIILLALGTSCKDMNAPLPSTFASNQEQEIVPAVHVLQAHNPKEDGKLLYAQNCAICHGDDGKCKNGLFEKKLFTQKPTDLASGAIADSTEQYIFFVASEGFKLMKGFKETLTVAERRKISAYVKLLQNNQTIPLE